MLLTEKEAGTKECRAPGAGVFLTGGTVVRADFPPCIGSRCAHWDWSQAKGGKRRQGYCGLAGVPFQLMSGAGRAAAIADDDGEDPAGEAGGNGS